MEMENLLMNANFRASNNMHISWNGPSLVASPSITPSSLPPRTASQSPFIFH